MANTARERGTPDPRGLAPAVETQPKARHLTVSQAARLAVAAALEPSAVDPGVQPVAEQASAADRLAKLTIRLRRNVATQFAERARASGLSHGAYLTTLVHGTP